MSWPRLSFTGSNGKPWTATVKAWDGQTAMVTFREWTELTLPDCPDGPRWATEPHYCERVFPVARDNICWVNTEAAQYFGITGLKVIGVGYGAEDKLAAHLAATPK